MTSWLINLALLDPDRFPSLVPVAIFLCILFLLEGIYLFLKIAIPK